MARYKPTAKKRTLSKKGKQTKWAPFWIIPKMLGKGKKVHPSRFTKVKKRWRSSSNLKA